MPDPTTHRCEAIIINHADSKCGACGGSAIPEEEAHITLAGYYSGPRKQGCGFKWKYVTTDYHGFSTEAAARQIRPDLEWLPLPQMVRDERYG